MSGLIVFRYTVEFSFMHLVQFTVARTTLAFVVKDGEVHDVRKKRATRDAPCTANARMERVFAWQDGTGSIVHWKGAPGNVPTMAAARPTSTAIGIANARMVGKVMVARLSWNANATTTLMMIKVK